MSGLAKSAWEFGRGAWGSLAFAFAAIRDPLDIAKTLGLVADSSQWLIGASAMQAIFVSIAFIWMFVWFHRERTKLEWSIQEPNMPLHQVCRYVARDSMWAANFPPMNDQNWVSEVYREILSKWQFGRFEMMGNHENIDGITQVVVPAMKGSTEFNAHWLVSDEPPTHVWSHKHRTSERQTTVYYRVHMDRKYIERTWPKRSLLSRFLRRSPIERIGGYKDIFQKQDAYYREKNGFSPLSLNEILG